jgi:DNA transposition AAA+ family ATPase
MGRAQARAVLAWISRKDAGELNEIALTDGRLGLDRTSIPGRWVGRGAELLGLSGDCDLAAARRLFIHGTAPDGQLVTSAQVERSFYSGVFDVDKTVSLLLAHRDPLVRQALAESIEIAFQRAFSLLESLARIRRGKGGVRSEKPVGLTGLRFVHSASSTGDPHSHVHLMVLATAQGADGRWITLDGRQIFAQGMRMAVQEFQIELYRELQRRVDLAPVSPGFVRVGSTYMLRFEGLQPAAEHLSGATRSMATAWREISGRKIVTGLSHRQHKIVWARHRRGKRELAEQLEHELDEILVEDGSRARRLRQLWRDKMAGLAPTLDQVKVYPASLERLALREPSSDETYRRQLKALHTFNLADLSSSLRFRFPGLDGEGCLLKAAELVVNDPYFVTSRELKGALREWIAAMQTGQAIATATLLYVYGTSAKYKITTTDALNEERTLETRAMELSEKKCKMLLPVLPASATFEQVRAIETLSRGRALCVVSGVAGSGKTFVLRPITEAAKRSKLAITVLARNANLARDLGEELSVPSYTLAAFKLAIRNNKIDLTRPQMIIVDEAGLVDYNDWQTLLDLSEKLNVQIVAVGDRRQSQPIDGRASFATVSRACQATGSYQMLETTYRNQAWVEEATAIREAQADKVVELAEAEGRLIGKPGDEILDMACQCYAKYKDAGEDVVLLARDNATAADLASAVQESLGIVGTHEIAKEESIGIGDEVRARRNVRTLGITNGDRFKVVGFVNSGIVLTRLDNRRTVLVAYEYAQEHIELAYCATIDSVQGQTRDRVIVLVDAAIGNTLLYSGATRGRNAPIYLVKTETNSPQEILANAITNEDLTLTIAELIGSDNNEAELIAGSANLALARQSKSNLNDAGHIIEPSSVSAAKIETATTPKTDKVIETRPATTKVHGNPARDMPAHNDLARTTRTTRTVESAETNATEEKTFENSPIAHESPSGSSINHERIPKKNKWSRVSKWLPTEDFSELNRQLIIDEEWFYDTRIRPAETTHERNDRSRASVGAKGELLDLEAGRGPHPRADSSLGEETQPAQGSPSTAAVGESDQENGTVERQIGSSVPQLGDLEQETRRVGEATGTRRGFIDEGGEGVDPAPSRTEPGDGTIPAPSQVGEDEVLPVEEPKPPSPGFGFGF